MQLQKEMPSPLQSASQPPSNSSGNVSPSLSLSLGGATATSVTSSNIVVSASSPSSSKRSSGKKQSQSSQSLSLSQTQSQMQAVVEQDGRDVAPVEIYQSQRTSQQQLFQMQSASVTSNCSPTTLTSAPESCQLQFLMPISPTPPLAPNPPASPPPTATTSFPVVNTTSCLHPGTRMRIVKLNIGGRKFVTTEGTLTSVPEDCFFNVLLKGKFSPIVDEEGSFFIDRDGTFFEPILTYLRTGQFSVPSGMSIDDIYREVDFYGITPLLELISARRGGGVLFLKRLPCSPETPIPTPNGITSPTVGSSPNALDSEGGSGCISGSNADSVGDQSRYSGSLWRQSVSAKSVKLMCTMSNVVAVAHQDSTISAWKYQGLAAGWKPIMLCKHCDAHVDGIVMSESKNSIEQIANTFLCAYSKTGSIQLWDRLHDPTYKVCTISFAYIQPQHIVRFFQSTLTIAQTWSPFSVDMVIDHVTFLVNTWFLAALARNGSSIKIMDLRATAPTFEVLNHVFESSITCTAEADPFLFFGCSNGSVGELKQDMFSGVWVVSKVFQDPENHAITCLHCAAIADRQSTKIYLCIGTEQGSVRLCSKLRIPLTSTTNEMSHKFSLVHRWFIWMIHSLFYHLSLATIPILSNR
ncbi:NY-REN-45 antigen [Pelomyxa schiedti]|nr:NY-REN-45 antigen [Pelomyxa schiedti]